MPRSAQHLARAALGLACLAGPACSLFGPPSREEAQTLDVSLVNNADEAIHILARAEEFGPGNRISPGGARSVVVITSIGEPHEFRAGRNGQVLTTVTCTHTDDDVSNEAKVVIYSEENGSGGLACANW